ncbi:uncharacterized protein LOC119090949 [Pollicipes pollicipes]|uniref:uncharacterized protein LOC119090949 n=1 Tax=Pollicipes pollicipes TaxID=41117 RepID=UPI001884DC80|nr:uncharacterized protein LOC119090949 [Pollicipes pollicipes]
MTNNKSKPDGMKKSNTLPPLDIGNKSPGSVRRSPPQTAEGRRRTRSVEPDSALPLLEAGRWRALEHATSVESVATGRSLGTATPSSPRLSPREEAPRRTGSFRLADGLQHRQPRIKDEPLAEPRGGKPLNLQPLDTRRGK